MSVRQRTWAAPIVRLLLRLYPRRFRETYGAELGELHCERYNNTLTRHGRWVAFKVVFIAAIDLAAGAPAEHFRERRFRRSLGREGNAGSEHRRGDNMMRSVLQDIRYACRSFARQPGFTLVAVSTLALGIGANIAIFSVVNGVLLRPLPYSNSAELVHISHASSDDLDDPDPHTPGNFLDWRAGAESFEAMAAYRYAETTLIQEGQAPFRIEGAESVGSLFDVLRVPPLLGRTFTSAEDLPGPEPVMIISERLWRSAFGSEDVVGTVVQTSEGPHTILGVMPATFRFPLANTEFWVLSSYDEAMRRNRTEFQLWTVARLGAGTTLEQARNEMRALAARLRTEFPDANRDVSVRVVPLRDQVVSGAEPLLWVLTGAVGLVLLVACANLANLLLSRNASRFREIAIRRAVGAGSLRIVRQMMTESAVLAAAGCVVGVGLGALVLEGILTWMPGGIPRAAEVGMDDRVLLYAVVVAAFATVVFGGLPALRVSRLCFSDRMARGREGLGEGSRSLLVALEVAMAVVLLAGASVLTRSFVALSATAPRYDARNRITFQVQIPDGRDLSERVTFFRQLEERLQSIPGVRSVGYTTGLPASMDGSSAWLTIVGRPVDREAPRPLAAYRVVNPNYLDAMGVPLLRGRGLSRGNGLHGEPAVLINEALVREYFANEEVLGRQITLGPDGGWIPPSTIVGVVGDVRMEGPAEPAPPVVYSPHELMPWWGRFSIVLHTPTLAGESLVPTVRRVVAELDPNVPISRVGNLERLLSSAMALSRNSTILMTLFAGVTVLMAAVGVFGVLSFTVSQRTREVGIRMAMGADAARVRRLVLTQGMKPVLTGLASGIVVAWVAVGSLRSLVFKIETRDPVAFGATTALMVAVAAVAIYLPARRATAVDPVESLRAE